MNYLNFGIDEWEGFHEIDVDTISVRPRQEPEKKFIYVPYQEQMDIISIEQEKVAVAHDNELCARLLALAAWGLAREDKLLRPLLAFARYVVTPFFQQGHYTDAEVVEALEQNDVLHRGDLLERWKDWRKHLRTGEALDRVRDHLNRLEEEGK